MESICLISGPGINILEKGEKSESSASKYDGFDDWERKDKLHLPAELQSPKMIIEEQVDKVVTKIDSYSSSQDTKVDDALAKSTGALDILEQNLEPMPKNDVYQMDDGGTLLERCIPEAISSTTIAKETFVVRPANGDIFSTWMDVTHTSVRIRDENDQEEGKTPPPPHHRRDHENESIVLDIAGYKTEEDQKTPEEIAPDGNLETPLQRAETSSMDSREETVDSQEQNKEEKSESAQNNVTKEENTNDNIGDNGKAASQKADIQQHLEGHIQLKPGETYRIEMSLCGLKALGSDAVQNETVFNEHQITYDNFVHNPNVLNDRRLVFRHKGRYYATGHRGYLFTSLLVFRGPLQDHFDNEHEEADGRTMSDSRDSYTFGRGWRQWLSRSSVAAESVTAQNGSKAETTDDQQRQQQQQQPTNEKTTFTTTTKTTSVGWAPDYSHSDEAEAFPRKNYAKTLRLTSEQLKSLSLKKGVNTVSFSVTSAIQGTATCAAKIFFWDYDVNVVISDIDGTITKSDTLGHLYTMIGKDWTHSGVAKLYTDIQKNGYHLLYLTSRAIGQADYTRDYLKRIEQDKYQLPDGPVIMSPDRLFTSLHREVIMRKPEVFKMACLRDVLRLFGGRNPFYAGFGNRITDAISYSSVNVPASRIFTIDPSGDVKLELLTGFKSSYIHLNDLVDQIFPPINKSVSEEFSDYNFWKAPLPEIELPDLPAEPTPTSPKPKPIVPDPTTTLPPSSVVAAASPPERRQRGILRSFTSRSSAPAAASTLRVAASSSTPSLVSSTTKARNSSEESDRKPAAGGTDTSLLDSGASSDDQLSPTTPPPVDSSSSSIVNKVLGGVFSRTFARAASPPPISSAPASLPSGGDKLALDSDHGNDNDDDGVYEEADDETFDATLDSIADEIDMDNIPFI